MVRRHALGEEVDTAAALFTGEPVIVSLVVTDSTRALEWRAADSAPDGQPRAVVTAIKDRGEIEGLAMIRAFTQLDRAWNIGRVETEEERRKRVFGALAVLDLRMATKFVVLLELAHELVEPTRNGVASRPVPPRES